MFKLGFSFRFQGIGLQAPRKIIRLHTTVSKNENVNIQVTNKHGKDAREEFGAAPQGGLISRQSGLSPCIKSGLVNLTTS